MLESKRRDYQQDGYCIVEGMLPADKLATVHEEMAEVLRSQLVYLGQPVSAGGGPDHVYALMKALFALDKKRYLACLRLISKLYSLQMLCLHPAVLDCIKALGIVLPVMQSRPVFHVMSNELRFENGYFGFGVHQDWPALQSSLDMVTVWIPLVDVDKDLFTLEMIPGSHLSGLLSGTITDHILEVDPQHYDADRFVPVEARLGDIVLMSAFTLHRSSTKGRDNDVRLATSCRYENALEKHFVENAFPFCQQTTVKRELLIDNFPNAQQVADACLKS